MDLIEVLQEQGFSPKKEATTSGGEFSSSCPKCGGKDRFRIWPYEGRTGRYWCRQCNLKGDGIRFAMEFMGKPYPEACEIFGQPLKGRDGFGPYIKKEGPKYCPVTNGVWHEKASAFALRCHIGLLGDAKSLELLKDSRGFSGETIKAFRLGYHEKDEWIDRSEWGLPPSVVDSKAKRLWLPKGIVIPAFESQGTKLLKLKIRRADYKEGDKFPKYYEMPGSFSFPVFYGDPLFREGGAFREKPVVLVESELDAILIQQFASKYCACLALGGATKEPDEKTEQVLKRAPLLLYALDWDKIGKERIHKWKDKFPERLKPCVVPNEKSPGDFYKAGGNLEKWVYEGLKRYNFFDNYL